MRNRQKKIRETLEKARPEYDSGNYWRAKEIIRSGLGTYGYDIELYSFYAAILLNYNLFYCWFYYNNKNNFFLNI